MSAARFRAWMQRLAPTRQQIAAEKLARMTEERRNSPAVVEYRKRRAAALSGRQAG